MQVWKQTNPIGAVEGRINDFDMQGQSIEAVLSGAFNDSLDPGCVHVLVDHPAVEPSENREEEIAKGGRPYATVIQGDEVVSLVPRGRRHGGGRSRSSRVWRGPIRSCSSKSPPRWMTSTSRPWSSRDRRLTSCAQFRDCHVSRRRTMTARQAR